MKHQRWIGQIAADVLKIEKHLPANKNPDKGPKEKVRNFVVVEMKGLPLAPHKVVGNHDPEKNKKAITVQGNRVREDPG